jgi:hypothetical protein
VLDFLLTQAQVHFKQHYSIMEKTYHMLALLLAQAQTRFKQHHSNVNERKHVLVFVLAQAKCISNNIIPMWRKYTACWFFLLTQA